MTNPLVSVVVPAYNRRRWIGECLDGVIRQTYPHIETIVVDDCSTDGTPEWIRSEPKYSFAQVHVHPRNKGAAEARNTGVRLSRGEYITFADSDDVMEPKHIETAVRVLQEKREAGLFGCDATMIDSEGEVLYDGRTWHEINGEIKRYPVASGMRNLKDIFIFSNIGLYTIRRSVFDEIGDQDQSLFPLEDYDMALRAAGRGFPVYYWHEPLSRYRVHGANSSGETNVRVCHQKLRCLNLALERNPELRETGGGAVRRRVAEVEVELAISYLYAGQGRSAVAELTRAVGKDPAQLFKIAQLASRRLRRKISGAN